MDPKVTLGVLCDQFAPLSTDADEDEQVMRDRLRSLVIAFLTGEAKRAIVERHAVFASAVSSVLTRDMLEVWFFSITLSSCSLNRRVLARLSQG